MFPIRSSRSRLVSLSNTPGRRRYTAAVRLCFDQSLENCGLHLRSAVADVNRRLRLCTLGRREADQG